jgi:hypothetical protein
MLKYVVVAVMFVAIAGASQANAANLSSLLGLDEENGDKGSLPVAVQMNGQSLQGHGMIASVSQNSESSGGYGSMMIPTCGGLGGGLGSLTIDLTINLTLEFNMSGMTPTCCKPVASACGCSGF